MSQDSIFGPVETYDNFNALIERSGQLDRLSLVCTLIRPGTGRFLSRLEHEHFPPGTPQNDDLDLHIVNWQGLQFAVVMVPLTALPVCERLAAECGFELSRGIPVVTVDNGLPQRFPIYHERVRSVKLK